MLTTFDLEDYVYAALRAGASGFMLKDGRRSSWSPPSRVVARGDALLAPQVTRRLIEEVARHRAPEPRRGGRAGPAHRARAGCAAADGAGMSNGEIAGALYLGEATVKTHVGRVLGKLEVRDRVQAVVAAYESGLVEPGGSRQLGGLRAARRSRRAP